MKIKVFNTADGNSYKPIDELQKEVNDFIENLKVIDIKYTFNGQARLSMHSFVVLYEEKESEK